MEKLLKHPLQKVILMQQKEMSKGTMKIIRQDRDELQTETIRGNPS